MGAMLNDHSVGILHEAQALWEAAIILKRNAIEREMSAADAISHARWYVTFARFGAACRCPSEVSDLPTLPNSSKKRASLNPRGRKARRQQRLAASMCPRCTTARRHPAGPKMHLVSKHPTRRWTHEQRPARGALEQGPETEVHDGGGSRPVGSQGCCGGRMLGQGCA